MNPVNGPSSKYQPEQVGETKMQGEQSEIKIVILPVIGDPVVQEQKEKDNSYPDNGSHDGSA
jgi:hypothetical protein